MLLALVGGCEGPIEEINEKVLEEKSLIGIQIAQKKEINGINVAGIGEAKDEKVLFKEKFNNYNFLKEDHLK